MFIVPLGVIWAGYSLGWYGFCMVKGPGMGFADLIIPSRIAKADGIFKTLGVSSSSNGAASGSSSTVIPNVGPGVQPGSIFYPKNPKGGLPSKPPLGPTTPSGYS